MWTVCNVLLPNVFQHSVSNNDNCTVQTLLPNVFQHSVSNNDNCTVQTISETCVQCVATTLSPSIHWCWGQSLQRCGSVRHISS